MIVAWWLSLMGCASDEIEAPVDTDNGGVEESLGEPGCENLDATHCLMPFPSDLYRDASGDQAVIRFPDGVLPVNARGERMSGGAFLRADGYGVGSPVLVMLPGAVADGLPGVFDPAASMLPDSGTVMLDATTGQRIGHWVEMDYLASADAPVMILRPAEALPRGRRVIVALRGVKDATGAVLPASEGFAALRDRLPSAWRGVHARRDRFEREVFPVLAAAGVERADLQLAWDFTVATDRNATADLVALRQRALQIVGGQGPAYTMDRVEEAPDADTAFIFEGTAQVPSFLLPPDSHGLRRLRRDADGLPVAEGTEAVVFRVTVPNSAVAGTEPTAVMQYGHGFLGSISESNNGWLRSLANEYGFLVLASNLQGMSDGSLEVWLRTVSDDGGRFPWLADEAMQGVINHLALQRLIRGGFDAAGDPRFRRADGGPLTDDRPLWYDGNSQGGTFGTVILGNAVDVLHGGLGVPGAAYPFLLHRSVVFSTYAVVIGSLYPDPGDLSLFLGLLGTGWDQLDPLTWAPHIEADPLPGLPVHHALVHIAKEDAQVHNEVSFLLGRAIGAPLPTPAVREPWGLVTTDYPVTGSAVVEFDFGIPDDPTPLTPPIAETDTHGWLRRDPVGREQLVHFLRTGEVIDACGGPCVRPGSP